MHHFLFTFIGLGGAELLFIALLYFGLIIWALVDVIRSNFEKDINKLIWIILIVCMPFIGSILYLLIGRGQRISG